MQDVSFVRDEVCQTLIKELLETNAIEAFYVCIES